MITALPLVPTWNSESLPWVTQSLHVLRYGNRTVSLWQKVFVPPCLHTRSVFEGFIDNFYIKARVQYERAGLGYFGGSLKSGGWRIGSSGLFIHYADFQEPQTTCNGTKLRSFALKITFVFRRIFATVFRKILRNKQYFRKLRTNCRKCKQV
jgi:hypothetical protein